MDFEERFATEDDCRDFLFACRWPEGFVCPRCDGRRAGQPTRRHLSVCGTCGLQTSVTAGTVMHGTRTPLRTWFAATRLVATDDAGISAGELQRRLGLSRYETAWMILQKLRRAMVTPERALLHDEVEAGAFVLGGAEDGRRGGGQRGALAHVGVVVEVRGRGSGRLRMAVLPDASGLALARLVADTTTIGAAVHTDAAPVEAALAGRGFEALPRDEEAAAAGEPALPRVVRAIAGLRAWIDRTHGGVSAEHLPGYLDEFVFRANRRGSPMASFEALLGLGAGSAPTTYDEITGRSA